MNLMLAVFRSDGNVQISWIDGFVHD